MARPGKLANRKLVRQAPKASQANDCLFETARNTFLPFVEQEDLALDPSSFSSPAVWKMLHGGKVESKKDKSASSDFTWASDSNPVDSSQESSDERCPAAKTREAAYLSDSSVASAKVCWADMEDDDDNEAPISFEARVKSIEGPPETQPIAMPQCNVRTVTITNYPASCTKDYLVKAMESLGFEGKQDYFMLPMKGCANMGFAHIGFPDSDTTQHFAEHMAGFLLASPPGTSDDAKCNIIPSRVQGLVNCQPRSC